MKYFKAIGLFLVTIAIFAVGLIGFSACAGNTEIAADIPEFEVLEAPPIEVTIDQLYQEYLTDEAAANARYEGKRLLFTNVVVERLDHFATDPSANVPNIYIVNDSVEFRPRYWYWADVATIREGFVVDIVGTPRGLFGIEQQYLVVEDCRIFIIEGDVGAVYDVVPEY